MSRIRANEITNQNANGAPNFPNGITVTGVVTATTITQNINGDLTVSGNVGIGGTLTYEDVTNIDSIGIITARNGIDAPSNLLLKTGGDERLRIDSDGKVGIGTDEFYDNTTKLEVRGRINTVGSASTGSINTGNGTVVNMGSLTPHDLQVITGNSTRMTIKSGTGEALRIGSTGYVTGNVNVPAWFGMHDTQYTVSSGTWTKVYNLATTPINPAANNGGWDESSGRFTVQTGQAGTYYIYGGVGIDDIQQNDYVQCRFYKNGSGLNPIALTRNAQATNQIVDVRNQMMINLSEGDYVEFYVYHNEGTSESTEANRTFFGGYRLAV